ncbi:hypothetical protein [Streptomyces sp. NPDC004050]
MSLVDGPEILLGVRHLARRPAFTVLGGQRLKGQLSATAQSAAQGTDRRQVRAAPATKVVTITDPLTTSAARQLASPFNVQV